MEGASDTFYVEPCEKAFINLKIGDTFVGKPVEFVLTVAAGGTFLPGGDIDAVVYLPDDSLVALSWTDHKDSTYTAVYTPSLPGDYLLSGTVTVSGDTTCFWGFFAGRFAVEEEKLPDLIIRNEDITITPEPQLNATVTISVTVWNSGDVDAEGFYVVILINDDVVHDTFIEVLAAGESTTITYQWTIQYSGSYIVQAIADPPEGLL